MVLGVAACYAPSAQTGVPCSGSFECPLGQECNRDVEPPTCGVASPPIDAEVGDAPSLRWNPPVLVMAPTGEEDDPTLTGDLLEMYFNRDQLEMWRVRRTSPTAAWGVPEPVIELDPSTTPEITGDGLTIYIGSRRPGGLGSDDIWVSTRPNRDALWAPPVHVPELSSLQTNTNATPSDDHLSMVLVHRTGAITGVDIYASQRGSTEDAWAAPLELPQLTSASSDGDPMLSSDGLEIYFYSTRTAGGDLYVARRDRVTDPFRNPEPITELNTDALDQDPWISPDGRHLFFASDRSGVLAIYEATR